MDEALFVSIARHIVQDHQTHGPLEFFHNGSKHAHKLLFSPIHIAWFDLTMASSFQLESLNIKGSQRRHEII